MERHAWHDGEVHALLTVIKDQHSFTLLDKQIKRNEFIYREIEQDMRAKGYRKSAWQIRMKFRQMKKGFLAIVRRNDFSKADRHTQENLDLLKEIFKYHPSMLVDRTPQQDSINNCTSSALECEKASEQWPGQDGPRQCTNDDEATPLVQELMPSEARDPLNCREDELGTKAEMLAAELLQPAIHTATLLRNAIRVEATDDTLDETASMEDYQSSAPKRKRFLHQKANSTPIPAKLSSPLITRAIAGMIVKDLQPLSITEQVGFRDLMNFLAPQYSMPSRTTISTEIIPKLYHEERAKLRGFLNEELELGIEGGAFTIDVWTSPAINGYLTLTMHFLTHGMELKTRMLDIRQVPDVHTAEDVSDFIHAALNAWGLTTLPSPMYFVTDNSGSTVNAIRLNSDNWGHIPCLWHTLQLAVSKSLKRHTEVQNVLEKASGIVAYLNRSSEAATALKKAQRSVDAFKPLVIPHQDVPQRWNSQYDMLSGLIELRAALEELSKEGFKMTNLNENEWQIAAELKEFFKPLKAAAILMEADKHPTAAYNIPVMKTLQKMYSEFEFGADFTASKHIENVHASLTAELTKKLEDLEYCKKPLLLAMVLDPRFKLKFVATDQRQEVEELLISECANRAENTTDVYQEDLDSSSNIVPSVLKKFYDLMFGEKTASNAEQVATQIQTEISIYFHEARCERGTDVLQWWRDHVPVYPNLGRLAKAFLHIPAIHTSSERLFSNSKNIELVGKPCLLLTEHVEEIVFLHENL